MVTYILPLPSGVIYASVAAAGMRLRTFLLIDIATAAVTRAIFIYLGYWIGEPAVRVVEVIARYSWYLSIALLVGIFFNLWRQSRARRKPRLISPAPCRVRTTAGSASAIEASYARWATPANRQSTTASWAIRLDIDPDRNVVSRAAVVRIRSASAAIGDRS